MMPLLEELFAQPILVIIIAAIAALIFIAFAIVVFMQMRQMRRRSARRRERQMQIVKARRAAVVTPSEESDEESAPPAVMVARNVTAPLDPAKIEKAAAQFAKANSAAAPTAPTAAAPDANAAATTPAPDAANPESNGEQQPEEDAMSSLLSDVFGDEEASDDRASLLNVIEPVDVHELAALTKEIAAQLGMNDVSGASL